MQQFLATVFDSNDVWAIGTAVPLVICSIAALALIAERLVYLLSRRGLPLKRHNKVLEQIHHQELEAALTELEQAKPYYLPAVKCLEEHANEPKEVREEAVAITMHGISHGMRRRMSGLLTVASLAPMLGLLGTIIGLMRSFKDIGAHDGPVEPSIVADGLWQALTTTAAGLVIAVICVLTHALLSSRVRHALAEAGDLLNRLNQSIERQQRSKP
ncbi:MotA/TolQ/ExbB proton channel family protein [Ferrimonas senticii]|uniref:MotA/TolQ/ExbB proton channel family protein n=1 Tax=Ferrimonas senticii TaxID=394566 RepID=UPI000418A409|nr:MotA/TolQ/ExbB proton channel family protein [Ferrimonas senticii]